jgi:Ferritin-like domain
MNQQSDAGHPLVEAADAGRSSRRAFVTRGLALGGGVAAWGLFGSTAPAGAATASDVLDFGNAAVGAERIAVAFYSNALGLSSDFGVSADLAKGTLLNSAHREYFKAARNQEASHLATLLSLPVGLSFPFTTFSFPAGTFRSAPAMLAMGEQLERVFIGAYLGAIKVAATVSGDLGVFVAEAAGQILGVECEHRVLIRDIAGEDPPNDRFYEGDIGSPSNDLGNTGVRSTVYATASDAVNDLLALGITPVN